MGLLLPGALWAQPAPQAQAQASVIILARTLSVRKAVEFAGNLAAGTEAREVVVDPTLGSVNPILPGSYELAGRKDSTFALALPGATSVTLNGAGASMAVKQFRLSVNGGPATDNAGGLVFNRGRSQNFKVGATLVVAAGQPKRAYAGNFNMTLAYN